MSHWNSKLRIIALSLIEGLSLAIRTNLKGNGPLCLRDSSLEAQDFSICFASRLLGIVSPSALPFRDLMPILLKITITNCATSNNKAEMAMFTNTSLEYEPTDKRSGSELRLFRDTSLLIIDGHLSIHPPFLRSAKFPSTHVTFPNCPAAIPSLVLENNARAIRLGRMDFDSRRTTST